MAKVGLLIGSTAAYSGKTATVIGLADQLQKQGLTIAYGKPLGNCLSDSLSKGVEADVEFITQSLALSEQQVRTPLLCFDRQAVHQQLQTQVTADYAASLHEYVQAPGDIMLLEGAGTLWEGSLFNLSVEHIAEAVDASVLLVSRYGALLADSLLAAKRALGDRLIGVLINDIPLDQLDFTKTLIKPFLEKQGIEVLGMLPNNSLLRSVSVREISQQLEAKILCRHDRLDLMVEKLYIGAMNVNSALEYFRQGRNIAVVTGGDRTDLQLAALEASTHCLILTGPLPPQPLILSRAEDLEIPILSVDLDTLTTVEIVDRTFGQARVQEPIKIECIKELMAAHFNTDRLIKKLGLQTVSTQ